jgi:iron complex transport system substrate-binding protein
VNWGRWAGIVLAIVSAAALTACGGQERSNPTTDAGAGNAYPVTVPTVFGDVRIPQRPQRVVALGWSDAETALALGVQPVGASDWLAFGGDGVGPWAKGRYATAPTLLGTNEINYEAVAALEPDLILNTRSDGDKTKYDLLSRIAPTVSPPPGVVTYGTSWQQQMRMVSRALGLPDRSEALIAEVDKAFADAAAANPGFAGRTVGLGAFFSGRYGAYVKGDSRAGFMAGLGFRNKPEIDALAGPTFSVTLSGEQVGLLSAELTVVFPIGSGAAALRQDKLLNQMPAATAGRLVILDDQALISAFSSGSTLGIRYALEHAVPLFAKALAAE